MGEICGRVNGKVSRASDEREAAGTSFGGGVNDGQRRKQERRLPAHLIYLSLTSYVPNAQHTSIPAKVSSEIRDQDAPASPPGVAAPT